MHLVIEQLVEKRLVFWNGRIQYKRRFYWRSRIKSTVRVPYPSSDSGRYVPIQVGDRDLTFKPHLSTALDFPISLQNCPEETMATAYGSIVVAELWRGRRSPFDRIKAFFGFARTQQ